MNILVTGGLGLVGRPLVQRLRQHGHGVRVLDRQEAGAAEELDVLTVDITDFAAVREAVRGMDAVAHLAALTHPAAGSGPDIFRINCAGSYNVYEAAAQEGIRRVVTASSINAFGFNYGVKPFPIQYLPIDEQHPGFTTDPYSFSKQVVEHIAAYYWRRDGISGVQLRLPAVIHWNEEFRALVEQFTPVTRQAFEQVLAMPEAARQARAGQLIAEIDQRRARRESEKPWSGAPPEGEWKPDFNDPLPLISFGFTDFWAMIHDENSAQAFEKGLSAEYEGSQPLFVADAINMLNLDAETLACIFYPEAARKRPLVGCEPLVSYDQARQLIGYAPENLTGAATG